MVSLVELVICCCSVDLILTGQEILAKWQHYLGLIVEKKRLLNSIKSNSNYVCNGEQMMKIIDIPL